MGRQAYVNMVALGRSPYEAPETPPAGHVALARSGFDSIDADGYVQEYDARGHPVNPSSKALARQLRRAKNDILSTMGIVVSGEDGNLGTSKERQRLNLLAAENDYGLAVATMDQVLMFASSWWTTSLRARIQTFKSYTHIPLMGIIRLERNRVGIFAFYCSGIPAWSASFLFSVCRHHFLDPATEYLQTKASSLFESDHYKRLARAVFTGLKSSIKLILFIILGQTYMFSYLQSLHLIPATTIPTLRSLLRFGEASLIRLPPIPHEFSLLSVGRFGINLLTAPFTMAYLYVHLRPVIEGRVYRLLRRRLPRPDRPDNWSIRVALENDLIEWTVPTLGRRWDEEARRSQLTIGQELRYELAILKNWILGLFGWEPDQTVEPRIRTTSWEENLRRRTEEMQRINSPFNGHTVQLGQMEASMRAHGEQRLGDVGVARPNSPNLVISEGNRAHTAQILADEEQRMVQSPLQLPDDYFGDMRPPERTGTDEDFQLDPSRSTQLVQSQTDEDSRQRHSRSNTLFSHPSSAESSPLTSPRVRASLVHQNSDVITMQLELLQSSRHTNSQNQGRTNSTATSGPLPNGMPHQSELSSTAIDRVASELLDVLLSSPGQNLTDGLGEQRNSNNELILGRADTLLPAESDLRPQIPDLLAHTTAAAAATPMTNPSHIPGVRSQGDQESHVANGPEGDSDNHHFRPIHSHPRRRPHAESTLPDHRVTILSSHPVDALSSHLATLVTSALFLPLESLYLRSLASNFLSTPYRVGALPLGITASTVGLSRDIRNLGAWFGGGGSGDMFSYIGKLILVMGLEAMFSAGIWGLGTTAAVIIGRRYFGWGGL